jgi:hypothetical protein
MQKRGALAPVSLQVTITQSRAGRRSPTPSASARSSARGAHAPHAVEERREAARRAAAARRHERLEEPARLRALDRRFRHAAQRFRFACTIGEVREQRFERHVRPSGC